MLPQSNNRDSGAQSARSVGRRDILRGVGAASVLAAGAGLAACTSSTSPATSDSSAAAAAASSGPWPAHPKFTFAFVNNYTTNPFFTPTQYGAADACQLTGCTYTWAGSEDGGIPEMVDAMNTAIDRKVDGIAVVVNDAKAYDAATAKAQSLGIPVVAYNSNAPSGPTADLAYIGQDLFQAGVAAGTQVLKYVHPGDLVAGLTAQPGALNIQPRIDGAKSVLQPAGVTFEQVATGTTPSAAVSAVESWYLGHQNVKFLYTVDVNSAQGAATTIKGHDLVSKGVHGSGFDLSDPLPQYITDDLLVFTVDQQPYLQGFQPVLQLFLYRISAGLVRPSPTDTGLVIVTKANLPAYTKYTDRYEGTSTQAKYLPLTGPITS